MTGPNLEFSPFLSPSTLDLGLSALHLGARYQLSGLFIQLRHQFQISTSFDSFVTMGVQQACHGAFSPDNLKLTYTNVIAMLAAIAFCNLALCVSIYALNSSSITLPVAIWINSFLSENGSSLNPFLKSINSISLISYISLQNYLLLFLIGREILDLSCEKLLLCCREPHRKKLQKVVDLFLNNLNHLYFFRLSLSKKLTLSSLSFVITKIAFSKVQCKTACKIRQYVNTFQKKQS